MSKKYLNGDRVSRSALWAVAIAAVVPSLAAWWYVYGTGSPRAVQVIYFVSKVLIFPFPLAWWWFFERRAAGTAPRMSRRADLGVGVASGLIIGGAIWAAYVLGIGAWIDVDILRERVQSFGAYDMFVPIAAFLCVMNSGLEEYYWRWFVFGRLARHMNWVAAALIAAAAFASHHFIVLNNHLQDTALALFLSIGVAVGGIIWSVHHRRSGRLGGVWVSHFLVDVAAMSCAYHMLF